MIVLDRTSARQHNLSQVRLVGDNVNEIMMIGSALDRAENLGLDLVLVSDVSTPPVVKVQDFRKIEYERRKAKKMQKKSSSQGVLKELQLRVSISDHDLKTKVMRGRKFLARGDKVKVVVQLRGRERENTQRAWDLVDRFIEGCSPCKSQRGGGPMVASILEPDKTQPYTAKPDSADTEA